MSGFDFRGCHLELESVEWRIPDVGGVMRP